MKRVCVYCGSNSGSKLVYVEAAARLGKILVKKGFSLVYGGSCVGLMGTIADSVLEEGGEVIGVIPESLMKKEVAHKGLTKIYNVKSMHQRKAFMCDLSDAFIALPGGYGTLEEFFEVVTWTQLGIQKKPCGLLNVAGYYDNLLSMLDYAESEKFIRPEHRSIIVSDISPEVLMEKLINYKIPKLHKWISKNEI